MEDGALRLTKERKHKARSQKMRRAAMRARATGPSLRGGEPSQDNYARSVGPASNQSSQVIAKGASDNSPQEPELKDASGDSQAQPQAQPAAVGWPVPARGWMPNAETPAEELAVRSLSGPTESA